MKSIDPATLEKLQGQGKKILVDYWSETCQPCLRLMPVLEKLESEFENVVFVKINAREYLDHIISLGINSVPTVVMYNGGDLIDTIKGFREEQFYREKLTSINAQ